MNYSLNLETGKKHLEAKGLSMSMGKTKIIIIWKNLHSLRDLESILLVFIVRVLEVIQYFVLGVSYG